MKTRVTPIDLIPKFLTECSDSARRYMSSNTAVRRTRHGKTMFIHRSTLRSSEHRATVEHYCDNCDTRIFPGDTYSVTVKVFVTLFNRWLNVRREHVHPSCPYDPGDPDEIVDRNWKQDNELSLAA